MFRFVWILLLVFACSSLVVAQDPYANKVAKASDQAQKAIARFQLASGLTAQLWAAEPLLANPVAFCFDEKGRCFVAETFRLHRGVTDNRQHKWTDDDLASRTIADRIAMYKKHLGGKFASYSGDHDRVRLVVDAKGAGKADSSTIFSDGYSRAEDGIGSSVLAWRGTVYYTCIPSLWLLKDTKETGHADVKRALHTGYGIHVAFLGHDLHGLKMGPDGKLYFSIGDRALNVEADGRRLIALGMGSVLRCNPDGSQLEIVHTGLRNPQELAFDEYGNLFTGDNNADGGDQARWVHLVEGGDSGWRLGFQYLPKLGIWNSEKMWHPQHEGQPLAHLPPLGNLASGPSGLTYHPGVSLLPERYKNHFFLSDFRGSSGGSGVHAFRLKSKGASFALEKPERLVWSVLATDCDFGPDGGFYLSDWVEGWNIPNKGRIYKLADAERMNDPKVAEVKKLLAERFWTKPVKDLVPLLAHDDMRIRQEAQFSLAEKAATAELTSVALEGRHELARIHAVWGLGQIARKSPDVVKAILPLLRDPSAEMRAQAAKTLGEADHRAAEKELAALLKDASPRVRFHAAMALSKFASAESVRGVIEMLRDNADVDPYLRHAGVMVLSRAQEPAVVKELPKDPSASVRLAALLAMRRLQMPQVAVLLQDIDPKLVAEAARAIYDEPIPAALPALAKLSERPLHLVPAPYQTPLCRRVLAAHYRLGAKDNALALAGMAANKNLPEPIRLEALRFLSQWETPSGRDPIVGLWRPMGKRDKEDVAFGLRAHLSGLITSSDKVRAEAGKIAADHGIQEIGPALRALVADRALSSAARVDALVALETLKDSKLAALAQQALESDAPSLRHEARRILLAKTPPKEAAATLAKVVEQASTVEKQGALALLADLKGADADAVLSTWMRQLRDRKVDPEIQLDILDAAAKRENADLKNQATAYEESLAKIDALAPYRIAERGGDAERGRRIYFDKSELSCVRCHKLQGIGGDVGPDLTGLSKRVKRDYILEAIVDPNKHIAKGYETVVLEMSSGKVETGILKEENAKEVRLLNADGKTVVVPKDQIDGRNRGPSAMPADLIKKMSRRELRDLVEFLAGQ
jgi:quinoprotein glucose dehydrogenase